MEWTPQLLARFRQGDVAALREVYLQHVDAVHRLGRLGFSLGGTPPRRVPGLGDRDAQNDFVQEVFVRAFQEQARLHYDGLRPYDAYVLQIGKNLRIDQLRRAGREVRLEESGDGPSPEGAEPVASPVDEEALQLRRLQLATQDFLTTQPKEVQDFVSLRFVEELAQAVVATRLGVTRRHVRTLEARVQDGLRAHLRRLGLWAPRASGEAAHAAASGVLVERGSNEG